MKALTWSIALILASSAYAQNQDSSELFTVKKESISQVVELDGVVQPVNQGSLAAQTSGRVVGLYVDVNDYVKKGQVLLEISAVQQSASLDAAKAQLVSANAQNREAQAQLNRYRQLFPKGAISKDQMDSAEARARSADAAVKSAQAAVEQAKESLGYTNITAPYDGIVTKRMVELGETVAPGTPLLSGFSLDELRVETEIPQRYQPFVSQVDQFTVRTAQGTLLKPTEFSLFSYADPQSHTFKTRLELPEKTAALVPGMWVKTEFNYGQREVLVVPNSAVLRRAELSAVYRVDNGQRALNPVRLGQVYGDYVEVLSGLEQGDVVVTPAVTAKGE
ncbi:efflux RND transporter periplasmic adaptor subunit [Vibrio mimicus]|uniref:efflux RND transporter periplasmic adaptor subunit n=1 Tax=Vibrio mimicus TaxID=674 RepID=UPI0011DC67BF|nr:efflux RND transporter periplasmic adaptor subunit [Vibrio mimicus]TXY46083.1 efflux RND transporter periplasmic adaptor subunit [Vibrio mimicus]